MTDPLEAAVEELRGIIERLELKDGKDALATVLAEFDRLREFTTGPEYTVEKGREKWRVLKRLYGYEVVFESRQEDTAQGYAAQANREEEDNVDDGT